MKAIMLGASRGMGRAVARRLAEKGESLFLLGRDPEELNKSAHDLQVRGAPGDVGVAHCDLMTPEGFEVALDAAWQFLGDVDTVIITAAAFQTQEALEEDVHAAQRLLTINFANTVVFCEHVRKRLLARGGGTLCVFSSVAGDRGRKPIAIYGSSKAGLSHYLESLDHRHRSEGLRTVCVKPGFVKTSMTEGLSPPPFAGECEGVSRDVVRAITRGTPVVYTPGIWRWVMWVIKRLPRFIMRRINF